MFFFFLFSRAFPFLFPLRMDRRSSSSSFRFLPLFPPPFWVGFFFPFFPLFLGIFKGCHRRHVTLNPSFLFFHMIFFFLPLFLIIFTEENRDMNDLVHFPARRPFFPSFPPLSFPPLFWQERISDVKLFISSIRLSSPLFFVDVFFSFSFPRCQA